MQRFSPAAFATSCAILLLTQPVVAQETIDEPAPVYEEPAPIDQPVYQEEIPQTFEPEFEVPQVSEPAFPDPYNTEPRPASEGSFFGAGAQPEAANPNASIDAFIQADIDQTLKAQQDAWANEQAESTLKASAEYFDAKDQAAVDSIYQEQAAAAAASQARREAAATAAADAAAKRAADETAQRAQWEADRIKKEYDPQTAKALESCIAGFDNGSCVGSDSATSNTRSLVGDDLTDLLKYQNGDNWSKTSLANMSKNLNDLGESADTVGSMVDLGSDIRKEGFKKAVGDELAEKGRDALINGAVDIQADGRATTITPRAVTTTTIDKNGMPVIETTVEKTDYGAGVTKLATEALIDGKDIAEATGKSPFVAVPVIGGKYLKWVTKQEGGPGAGNAVQEMQNRSEIARAKDLNGALQQVAARDPNWLDRTVLPKEVEAAAAKHHTAYSREDGALVEKLYWQSWAKAREYRTQVGGRARTTP